MSIIIFGLFLSLSANSWFVIWLGMEMTLIGLSEVGDSIEGLIMYFIIQVVTSSLFLVLSLYSSVLIFIPILMKLGMAPLHFWIIQVVNKVSWFTFILIMTLQKLVPLNIMIVNISNTIIMLFMVISAFVGNIMGFNQTNVKTLLAYSSISNLAWMMSMYGNQYLLVYSMGLILTIIMFSTNIVLNWVPMQLVLFMNLMSLGGFPPFTGFFPKLMILATLNMFMGVLLMISSVMNLFLYIRVSNFMIMGSSCYINSLSVNSSLVFLFIIWPFIGMWFMY